MSRIDTALHSQRTCNNGLARLRHVRLDTPTYGITYHTAPLKMYGNGYQGEYLQALHARATVYHKTIIDVGCPEILLQGDTFCVRIGGVVVELWRQK